MILLNPVYKCNVHCDNSTVWVMTMVLIIIHIEDACLYVDCPFWTRDIR